MNFGVEGPSEKTKIERLRTRMVKNFFTSLLLSAGTPMLLAGDEFRRTQQGNNNAYCQDNEISWIDWSLAKKHTGLSEFCRQLLHFRKRHPAFKRSEFYSGEDSDQNGISDITWYTEKGKDVHWNRKSNLLAILIDGSKAETQAERDDNDFYIMFNAGPKSIHFKIAPPLSGKLWRRKIDTASVPDIYQQGKSETLENQLEYKVAAHSVVVLVSDSR